MDKAVDSTPTRWQPGAAPITVVMISLNEGHNMEAVCRNLAGWAQEVFLVDSHSQDETVDIALRHGVHVVQRRFRGFGDQWNFALEYLPITAPWTMKLDPDERLSDELKANLLAAIRRDEADGFSMARRLWLMGRALPVRQTLVRLWRTGRCRFTDIAVNEHPIVGGRIVHVVGDMEHHDSPDLDHWLEKQNRYTTAEAVIAYNQSSLAETPRLLGTALQRRMWLKKNFNRLPLRYSLLFLYHWLWQGAWRVGWVGYAWARLRADVMRLIEYKRREMEITGRLPQQRFYGPGTPDSRVRQFE
jgi:glycosyltransferase involved in cell wall biosynthesis